MSSDTIQKIAQGIREMNAGLEAADERRHAWRTTAPNVLIHLKRIASEANATAGAQNERIRLLAREFPVWDNMKQLQLCFGSIPTGILVTVDRASHGLPERGAILMLNPDTRGMIEVAHVSARVEFPGDKKLATLERQGEYEPSQLNNVELLEELATQFVVWAAKSHWSQKEKEGQSVGFRSRPPVIE